MTQLWLQPTLRFPVYGSTHTINTSPSAEEFWLTFLSNSVCSAGAARSHFSQAGLWAGSQGPTVASQVHLLAFTKVTKFWVQRSPEPSPVGFYLSWCMGVLSEGRDFRLLKAIIEKVCACKDAGRCVRGFFKNWIILEICWILINFSIFINLNLSSPFKALSSLSYEDSSLEQRRLKGPYQCLNPCREVQGDRARLCSVVPVPGSEALGTTCSLRAAPAHRLHAVPCRDGALVQGLARCWDLIHGDSVKAPDVVLATLLWMVLLGQRLEQRDPAWPRQPQPFCDTASLDSWKIGVVVNMFYA